MNLATLLSDITAEQRTTTPTPPPSAAAPQWVHDAINSAHGTTTLARHNIDITDALTIADALTHPTKLTTITGLPLPTILRAQKALASIDGLEKLGKSWAPDPVAGALSKIPAWGNRQRWLLAVSLMLVTPEGKAAINATRSSRPMVMRVARADAKAADSRTGREVRTSHGFVARRLRVSAESVRHARYVLERLGLSVTVVAGRYLTAGERAEARSVHGGWQRRIASTRALTLPKRLAVLVARHLPRRGSVSSSSSVSLQSPSNAGTRNRRREGTNRQAMGLPWQRLAAQVVQILPNLGEKHIGNLSRGLARLPIDPGEVTGAWLVRLVELRNRAKGYTQPVEPRSQMGLFLHQIRQAVSQL